jgi:hypothetical protein
VHGENNVKYPCVVVFGHDHPSFVMRMYFKGAAKKRNDVTVALLKAMEQNPLKHTDVVEVWKQTVEKWKQMVNETVPAFANDDTGPDAKWREFPGSGANPSDPKRLGPVDESINMKQLVFETLKGLVVKQMSQLRNGSLVGVTQSNDGSINIKVHRGDATVMIDTLYKALVAELEDTQVAEVDSALNVCRDGDTKTKIALLQFLQPLRANDLEQLLRSDGQQIARRLVSRTAQFSPRKDKLTAMKCLYSVHVAGFTDEQVDRALNSIPESDVKGKITFLETLSLQPLHAIAADLQQQPLLSDSKQITQFPMSSSDQKAAPDHAMLPATPRVTAAGAGTGDAIAISAAPTVHSHVIQSVLTRTLAPPLSQLQQLHTRNGTSYGPAGKAQRAATSTQPRMAQSDSSTKKKWYCVCCQQAFRLRHHLDRHMRTHTDEKPHACTFPNCRQAFRLRHHLDRHRQTQYTRRCKATSLHSL